MKEKRTRLIVLLLSVLLLLTAILPPAEVQAAKNTSKKTVKISCIKSGSALFVGSRKALSAKAGTKSSLTYKVSNKSLASVSKSGTVTAKRAGTVKVTITAAPKSRKFKKTARSISIKILPAKPSPSAKRSGNYVTVSVKAAKGASGHQYQYAPDKGFRKAKTKATSARSYKFNPGRNACFVRVRSFAKVGKGYYYSPWSNAIRVTAQAAQKPAATPTAKPTGTPTVTPKPTTTPKPTGTPKPTAKPTVIPKPTVNPTVTPAIKVSQISLSSESLSFSGARGDQQQLTASVFPEIAWKNSLKAELWTDDMGSEEKLYVVWEYIRNNFTFRSKKGEDTNKLYAYIEMKCDCVGASDMLGDFAYDLGAKVKYPYISGYGHNYNYIDFGDGWYYYDAQPGGPSTPPYRLSDQNKAEQAPDHL